MNGSYSTLPQKQVELVKMELNPTKKDFLQGQTFKFSWWIHGGEPGPDYRSDILRIEVKEGINKASYLQVLFDLKIHPPYITEKFELPINIEKIKSLAYEIIESQLIEKYFSEEKDPLIGGVVKETWQLEMNGAKLDKTIFEPFPNDLDSLRQFCEMLIVDLKEVGVKTIMPQPKR